jgi:hypothetical protein
MERLMYKWAIGLAFFLVAGCGESNFVGVGQIGLTKENMIYCKTKSDLEDMLTFAGSDMDSFTAYMVMGKCGGFKGGERVTVMDSGLSYSQVAINGRKVWVLSEHLVPANR